MSFSISTLLIRNLHDVFGENDAARRRAAIEEIFTEDCVFYDPKEASIEAAMRSIASRARLRRPTLISNISRLPNPKNWAMVAVSDGYRAVQAKLRLMPELTLSLRETVGSWRFVSFRQAVVVQSSELIPRRWTRHLNLQRDQRRR